MEQEKETQQSYPVWIDDINKIVSFKSAEGFDPLYFSSHNEMIDFVVKKGSSGYRIQQGDIGMVCYRYEDGAWYADYEAERPEYIKAKLIGKIGGHKGLWRP